MKVGWSAGTGSKTIHFFVGRYSACGNRVYENFRMNGQYGNYPHPWTPGWGFQFRKYGKKQPVLCKKCMILFMETIDLSNDFIRGDDDLQSIRIEVQSWK